MYSLLQINDDGDIVRMWHGDYPEMNDKRGTYINAFDYDPDLLILEN